MVKYPVIKKFIKGKTGEEIEIGRIIDVKEDRIEALKKLGIINKPVRSK
ncbi:unnamed protein product, partial [marine sediment metagenome]